MAEIPQVIPVSSEFKPLVNLHGQNSIDVVPLPINNVVTEVSLPTLGIKAENSTSTDQPTYVPLPAIHSRSLPPIMPVAKNIKETVSGQAKSSGGTIELVFSTPSVPANITSQAIVPYSRSTVIDTHRNYVTDGGFIIGFPVAGEFTKMIEYIFGSHNKMHSDSNYFEVTEKGLTYTGQDVNKSVMNHAIIYRQNLMKYGYETNDNKPHRFNVSADTFKERIKSFGAKQLILKRQGKEPSRRICMYQNEHSSNSTIMTVNEIMSDSYEDLVLPSLDYDEYRPNAVIPAPRLNEICSKITGKKIVRITVYYDGLTLRLLDSQGTAYSASMFHNNDPRSVEGIPSDHNIVLDGTVPAPIVKNLTKLNILAPNSVVLVYAQKGKPLLMKVPIRYLGELSIYIMLNPCSD